MSLIGHLIIKIERKRLIKIVTIGQEKNDTLKFGRKYKSQQRNISFTKRKFRANILLSYLN